MARPSDRDRFMAKVAPPNARGCWLWTAATVRTGYGTFRLGGKMHRAHRVSWRLHRGPIPAGLCCLHRCDVRACVNPAHLFLGTQAENLQDMRDKGRDSGPPPPRTSTKLNVERVRAIKRRLRTTGTPYKTIAAEFGVSPGTIRDIRRGTTWADVTES